MAQLRDKAYDALLQMIISQEILPSTPLDLSKIAAQLDMSTTPVRDAVKQLEAEGMVEMIPRYGTFVKHFTIKDLIQIYEFTEAIEGMAGYLLAERNAGGKMPIEELAQLDELIIKMEESLAKGKTRQWSLDDIAFHKRLCSFCGNEYLINTHATLLTKMNSVLSFMTPLYIDRQNSMREHRAIIEAIKEGNADEARQRCQKHRNYVRNIFLELSGKG